jgi:signal transduction protein with GAF and PtsI domain
LWSSTPPGGGGNRSNDLTQLILGVDRDTTNIAYLYPYGRRE